MSHIYFILGGAKSGKTAFALALSEKHPEKRLYLATAEAWDDEMKDRIARHQAERGASWETIEEPLDPAKAIRGASAGDVSVILVDCLTLWLSNHLAGQGRAVEEIIELTNDLIEAAAESDLPIIFVSNEVGQGIVPDNKLARTFRDLAGSVNQMVASKADEVYFVTAGIPTRLK